MSRQQKRKAAGLAKKGGGAASAASGGVAHVTHVPAAFSNNVAAMLAEAVGPHSAGRLDEAEHLYKRIRKQAPDNPDVLHLWGCVAHQKGDSRRAVTLIRKSLTRQPKGVEALNNLGLALCALGKLDEAEESFRKAIALSLDEADLHNNLGSVLQEQGTLDEAEASVRKALEIKPDFTEAWSNLGGILCEMKHYEQAPEACLRAVELNPSLPGAHNNLGLAFMAPGEWKKAEKHFNGAIGLKPDHTEIFNNLASLFSRTGRVGETKPELAPVFIVGLSRSGKTLVESLLAQHDSVRGGGESAQRVASLEEVVRESGIPEELPAAVCSLDEAQKQKAAGVFMEKNSVTKNHERHVVNTSPENYLYVGMSLETLPQAKVIHCRRDSVDTIFFSRYERGHAHAYDMGDMASYMADYPDLMAHWEQDHGDRVLSLPYEDLTGTPEKTCDKIYGFRGLSGLGGGESRIEDFLTTEPRGRWKNYESHPGPMLEALREHGLVAADSRES